jgi:hypothetical protein
MDGTGGEARHTSRLDVVMASGNEGEVPTGVDVRGVEIQEPSIVSPEFSMNTVDDLYICM